MRVVEARPNVNRFLKLTSNEKTHLSVYLRAMKCDFLIIGQGIAGTTLALELISRGAEVLMIDVYDEHNSSRVAAGLFNAVVFKRITLGWRAKESLKEAHRFYAQQEEFTGVRLFYPIGLHRIHGSEAERKSWIEVSKEPEFVDMLEETKPAEEKPWLKQTFGGAHVPGAGFIDTRTWLSAVRRKFLEKNILREETFDYDALGFSPDGVIYKDIEARKIIFCEGVGAMKNPWFSDLPFNPAKGEVLVINAPELKHEIFNGSIYGVPLGDGMFRVGSTYDWSTTDPNTTQEKRLYLEEKLRGILQVPFSVVSHEAGVRPTVLDRRPLIGLHPQHQALGIFNGLGTKGVLMAPLLAKEFVRFLLDGEILSLDASIKRFENRHPRQ